ncbi:MAG: class D beta-lactamase [Firmicutes bacterium]|nr:class D beta-lactamase [Bacillota bacterium]
MNRIKKGFVCILFLLLLTGCFDESGNYLDESASVDNEISGAVISEQSGPEIIDVDWSGYFDGMNGSAVIYDPDEQWYQIYNQKTSDIRRSPCSTFKIISSLIGLEGHIIEPDNSVKEWSGELYWNDDWNKDIAFDEAFRSSCVWYFREVVDEIGKSLMKTELEKLKYGNCDISDWEGRLNTNNNNRALTGFWIESSLKISPKEQTEVMSRIFGSESKYSERTLNQLKQVMMISEKTEAGIDVYGKTGMGKANGIVVDAWFTGFSDINDRRVYFCVYLGESQGKNVTSTKAKEIAVRLLSDYSVYAER